MRKNRVLSFFDEHSLLTTVVFAIVCIAVILYVFQGDSVRDFVRKEMADKKAAANQPQDPSAQAKDTVDPELENRRDVASSTPFSFEAEAKKVTELAKQLPSSKNELLGIVIRQDIYKKNNKEVKAHSLDEQTQQQMGAVKVMALRALMANEADPKVIRQDLDQLIVTAQDPTIVKIAKAAQESLDKGRPFFDDFLQAISDMPLAH